MQVLLGVAATVSPLLALGGVWLGARLGGLQEGSRWLRDQRQQAYVEYLDLLVALIGIFGVGMRVSKFGGQTSVDSGHNPVAVEDSFSEIMDDLHHLEQRLELIVGDDVWDIGRKVDGLILRIMDCRDDENVTEDYWDEIQKEGRRLLPSLQKAMRAELGVKSTSTKRRQTGVIRSGAVRASRAVKKG